MSKFKLKELAVKLNSRKQIIAKKVGADALSYFLKSFSSESWDGVAWQKRKKNKDADRNLLVKSGQLRRSVNNSLKKVTFERIEFRVPQPYAEVHNYGGSINKSERQAVIHFKRKRSGGIRFSKPSKSKFAQKVKIGAHSIMMPKRQFMGNSPILMNRIRATVIKELQAIS